jgi:multimeric flavodoxin WrbA
MARKIMVICGSPRKHGNTNTVTNWVVESARAAGAMVEVVNAASLKYKSNGCTECMACQKSDKYECAIPDEASEIIRRMPEFDVLVLSTPVFWFGPSAQLKLILDRTFALIKFDPATGEPILNPANKQKSLCVIATAAGDMDSGLSLIDQTFRTASKMMDSAYDSLLVPLAPMDPKELEKNAELRAQAEELGRRLAKA